MQSISGSKVDMESIVAPNWLAGRWDDATLDDQWSLTYSFVPA
jgi:hypothetical protein